MRYAAISICLSQILSALIAGTVAAWEPAKGPLMTRWSSEVSPDNALPEYPRPQMVREQWTNLNGLWQYAIRPKGETGPPEKWDDEILVPFAIESALSGVKKPVSPNDKLWYRRTFQRPKLEEGGRLLLHFGAVDWECVAWVNGKEVGRHTGGYDPFTFDITDALKSDISNHELVVAVTDPTDTGTQPRGKQVLKPHGIFYTAVTGIWQTVWLEPVPERHIESLKIVPDATRSVVSVTVNAAASGGTVRAQVRSATVQPTIDAKAGWIPIQATEKEGKPNESVEVPVSIMLLWEPDSPILYDLDVELLENGKVVDTVRSYFGMRKIEVKKDLKGVNRLRLNGKALFQYGPLDQGWWPDGLYTAPTDEALKYDIEMTKRLGFNMIRKHVKVEPARWYHWCDRLGVLVWQDMVSGDADKTDESKANFRREWQAEMDALGHFPSILMWVPFNEGWGQHDTEEVAKWTKEYDPTRVVNEASGWHDRGSGDISDMHNYPGPGMREPEPNRVSVLGEFGGLGMPVRGHTWQSEKNWGYVSYDDAEKLTDAYVNLLTMMRPLIGRGLAAAVYTQTTDVEIEVNGLMTYDRERVKMDEKRIVEAAKKLYQAPPKVTVLLPTSENEPQTWRYTTTKPDDKWFQSKFDDSQWKSGPGGFGTKGTPRAVVKTVWNTPDIWLRRTFDVETLTDGSQVMLVAHHDEDAEIYLNGTLVKSLTGFTRHYGPLMLDAKARGALKTGQNTIAVHCRQTGGGQYIDVGLVEFAER